MNRVLGIGALIGCVWSGLGYCLLTMPGVRESVRPALGHKMTYVLPLFPSAWVVPLFSNYEAGQVWGGLIWPLLTGLAAGAATGAAVAWVVVILRRRGRQR